MVEPTPTCPLCSQPIRAGMATATARAGETIVHVLPFGLPAPQRSQWAA
jgi:hypothetical protein